MPTRRIHIPKVNLFRSSEGVNALLAAIEQGWDDPERIVLDFSGCTFISAAAVAVLAAQKLRRDREGYTTMIDWRSVRSNIQQQFGRWRIAGLFDSKDPPWTGNAIPLLHQPELVPRTLVDYVAKWTVAGGNMPNMTASLAKEVRRNLCELFSNVFRHAESSIGGLAIGQLYPLKKEVQICICDAGVGIVRRVQSNGHALESAVDAIEWAVERGNSTWRGDEPPGLGLYLLREFIKVNGGVFRIYANNACYTEVKGSRSGYLLRTKLPGTLIDLRLQVRDDVTYTLTSAADTEASRYANFSS